MIQRNYFLETIFCFFCFSSFLFAVFGVIYGWASFQEEEKNYILAKIGAPISGLIVIFWIVLILIGLKG